MNHKNVTNIDSFRVKHIPPPPSPPHKKKLENSLDVKTNIFRIQAYDSKMCGCLCIGIIDFLLKSESLLEYTNLFFPNQYK